MGVLDGLAGRHQPCGISLTDRAVVGVDGQEHIVKNHKPDGAGVHPPQSGGAAHFALAIEWPEHRGGIRLGCGSGQAPEHQDVVVGSEVEAGRQMAIEQIGVVQVEHAVTR